MSYCKKTRIIFYAFILLLLFSWGTAARNITGSETLNNLIINSGEAWTVTSAGNITLTVNGDFIIQSGGKLTYHKGNLKNSDVSLTINVKGNSRIDGQIDFTGVTGVRGSNGSGTYSSGVGRPGGTGGRGTPGKNIIINVEEGSLEISGEINTKGGAGGTGGTGARGRNGRKAEFGYERQCELECGYVNGEWECNYECEMVLVEKRSATGGKRGGDGGTGGTGGNAGLVTINTRFFKLNSGGIINTTGGDRGSGGNGGYGGERGFDSGLDGGSIHYVGLLPQNNRGGGGANGSTGEPQPAIINTGYASISGSINPNTTINTDTTSPNQPVVEIEGMKGDYINSSNPVVSWNEVADNGSPASGIKEYIIEVSNGNKYTVPADGSTEYRKALTTSLADGSYTLTVTARDNAGNIKESTPIAFTVDTDKPAAPELSTTGVQSFQISVEWTQSSDENGIDSYIINYTVDGSSFEETVDANYNYFDLETEPNQQINIRVKAVDNAGNESDWSNPEEIITPPNLADITNITTGGTYGSYYTEVEIEPVEGEGIEYCILRRNAGADSYDNISEWFAITGEDYFIYLDTMGEISEQPHASYEYAVKIKSPLSGEGPINPYPEEVVISNNLPQLTELIGPADDSIFNKEFMDENEEIKFEVEYTDDDNDSLNYKYTLQKYNENNDDYETIGSREYSADNQYIYLTESLANGKYKWIIEVNDGYETAGDEYDFVVDTVAPDRPQFSLTEDNITGSGSVNIYDNILYTNHNSIIFKNVTVSSDVETINIYDGSTLIGSGSIEEDIPLELINSEGSKIVKITGLDRAGNESQPFLISCIYDKQLPGEITNMEYNGGENSLEINWNESSDNGESGIAYYLLEYRRVDGGEEDFTQREIPAKKQSCIINNLGFNEALELRLKVVDRAGNESGWYSNEGKYGYSLAEEAELLGITFDYLNPVDGDYQHYVHIKISPVTAKDMAIRYQKISEASSPVIITEWIEDISVENVIDIEVEPHGEYKYSFISRNNADELTESAELYFEVPNNKPDRPVVDINIYQYINQLPVVIETAPTTDPDMTDDLSYYFTVIDDNGSKIIERQESNLPENELDRELSYKLTDSELTEGQTYRWWVEVTDGYMFNSSGDIEYVKSEGVESLVDLTPPVINILTEENNDFHQSLIVKIRIEDAVSGAALVEYYWSNSQDEIEDIQLSGNEDITIEAPQGRNKLNIRAVDRAGNVSEWYYRYFIVDGTSPEMENFTIEARQIGADSYISENKITIRWDVIEDSAVDYYRYAVITEDELTDINSLPAERFTNVSVNSDQRKYIKNINITPEQDKKYYVVLEVINKSGLSSGLEISSNGVLIDNTPPVIGDISFQGVLKDGRKYYLNDLSSLGLEVEIKDEGCGLADTFYSFTSSTGNAPDWCDTLEEAKNSIEINDGMSCYPVIKAVDLLGNCVQAYSNAVVFDSSAPEIEEIIAGDAVHIKTKEDIYEVISGQQIPISFKIDDQIPLAEISYAVGTTIGSSDISKNLYPENDGWIGLEYTHYEQQFEIKENLSEGLYYITLRVANKAGLEVESSSNPVQVDNNLKPAPILINDGIYTTENMKLHFSWTFVDEERTVSSFEYQIITVEGELIEDWQEIGNKTPYHYLAENLELENGEKYFIGMRAVYENNQYSRTGYSDGITVDTTIPQELYIDDGSYSSGEKLLLKWDAVDIQSGISKYEIKIGKTPGEGEITTGWIVIDNSGEGLLRDLNLEDGQVYYTTLRVTNGAGLMSSTVSDGFIVDNTPAPEPIVLDGGKYTNRTVLEFDWKWSERDPESGIVEYKYALLTSKRIPNDNEWIGAGLNKELTIDEDLSNGEEYYLAVKAVNGAGLESIGYSDGILIDTTAPTPPDVIHQSRYQSYQDRIEASFVVEDRESGIDHCEYYIGTLENKEVLRVTEGIAENIDITPVDTGQIINGQVTITGLDLELGEIYFLTVKAINKVGLVSTEGISSGVKVIKNELEVFNLQDFGEYSHFADRIAVDWESSSAYLPIKDYKVAVSNTRYASDPDWFTTTKNSVLITPSMVPAQLRDGDKFIDGETYYVHVKAVDVTGYESEVVSTDGIKLDSTPPTKPEIIYGDTHTTNDYKLKWTSIEDDSRIIGYRYAVGTVRGAADISSGWQYIESSKEIYEDIVSLNLVHQGVYYLTVQARNITGLWSDMSYDTGRIADLTPPEMLEVEYNGNDEYAGYFITSKDKIEDISCNSVDPETGIRAYRYQVVQNKDGLEWEEVKEYEVNNNTFIFDINDLTLSETGKYHIAVQTKNRLGVWSETGFSQELIVDTTVPTIDLDYQGIELVTNDGSIEVPWSVSETADVFYRINRPDGSRNPEIGYDHQTADLDVEYIYDFNEDDQLEGIYQLEVYAVDEAGNRGDTVIQQVRINAKPIIDLGVDLTQYKGRIVNLSAEVSDKDGEIEKYIWDFGDGSEESNEISPTYIYTELGQYKITLTCIDNDGGQSSDSLLIDITNTREGELALDETWTGQMNILDTVIVPEGRTLIIKPGTEIIFPADTALLIKGDLLVEGTIDEQVVFREETGIWSGIKASGSMSKVDIKNAIITDTERGITLDSINGSIEGYFENITIGNSKIGIHLVNVSPIIKECQIINNSLFGIKEDGDCNPTLISNFFEDNLLGNYYDSRLTILTDEELRELNQSDQ